MNAKSVRTVSATVALMLLAGALAVVAPTAAEGRLFDPSTIRWIRNGGPAGGMGYDVRIQPVDHNILFATDVWSGVSKSMDGGKTWVQKNAGISTRTGPSGNAIPIFCLTICAQKPDLMWAGCQGFGALYKSMDSGEHWAAKSSGIPDLPGITFRSFTFDPTNPNIVYAGAEVPNVEFKPEQDKINESTGRIFKTVDGGEHWQQVLSCLALVRWILVNPRNTQVLYAATGIFDRGSVQNEGILESVDGGKTWNHANTGLDNLNVGGLDMDPSNPDILYASTGRNGGFGLPEDVLGGVFKTVNGGLLWKRVFPASDAQRDVVNIVNVAPSDPNVIYAMGYVLMRSTDAGSTWTSAHVVPRGESTGIPVCMAIDPRDPMHVFVTYYNGGVNETHDGGRTLTVANAGFTGAEVTGLSAGSLPYMVDSAGTSGVHVSTDYGRTWQGLQNGAMTWQGGICDVSVNPDVPLHLVASAKFDASLWRTTDGGTTWSQTMGPEDCPEVTFHYPLNLHGVRVFARSPGNPSIIYAGFQAAAESGPDVKSLGIFKSKDDGATWVPTNRGLESTDLNVSGVAFNPTDASIVYACFRRGGVYRSDNGGASWLPIAPTLQSISLDCIVVDPGNPVRLYVGTEGKGVYRSDDSGATWTPLLYGMDQEALIRTIIIHPGDSRIVFAGDWRTGVYCSFDSGSHWEAMSVGLTTRAVNRLALSANGKVLYAATQGEGVFTAFLSSGVPQVCLSGTPGSSRATLSWSLQAGTIEDWRFTIYRSTDPAEYPFERIADNVAGGTYVDKGLVNDTQYFYQVQGTPASGPGTTILSPTVDVTPHFSIDVDGEVSDGEWPEVAQWVDVKGDQHSRSTTDIRRVYAFTKSGMLYLRLDHWGYDDRGWVHVNIDTNADGKAEYYGGFGQLTAGGSGTGWWDARTDPPIPVPRSGCAFKKTDVLEMALPTKWFESVDQVGVQLVCFDRLGSDSWMADETGWISVHPLSETLWALVLPSAPTGMSVSSVTGGLQVTWQDAKAGSYPVQEYNVYRTASVEGSNAVLLATVPAAKTNYLDTTATMGTPWYYLVCAVDADDNPGASSELASGIRIASPKEIVLQLKVGSRYLEQGDSLVFMDTAPVIIAGRTLLPMRWIAEPLGAQVSWDAATKRVNVTFGARTLILWIGKNTATVDGRATPIDPSNPAVVPVIIDGRTMVPVRFVAENMGCSVEWNADTRTVTIRYAKEG